MSPRKLTEDDKQSMLKLYRNTKATTSTLAGEFGVSSSTVSRFLKNNLSTEEYDDLIQQKRLARTSKGDSSQKTSTRKTVSKRKKVQLKDTVVSIESKAIDEKPVKQSKTPKQAKKVVSSRKAEVVSSVQLEDSDVENVDQEIVETLLAAELGISEQQDSGTPRDYQSDEEDDDDFDVSALVEIIGEEIEDEDDELDDEDDELDEDEELEAKSYAQDVVSQINLEILPLASASLPRTCYLVIDRSSELIVKPLQEFSSLGSIPDGEMQRKTLPVFDNHRIAKKFSHRREKVIKVPDGKMLQKTSMYLYNKGITRLLIKGKLYGIFQD